MPRVASEKTRTLAVAALFAGACAIGTSAVLVKLADVGPLSSAFWRVALAVPVLWLWARCDEKPAAGTRSSKDFGVVLLAGLFFAGDLAFWHGSIVLTSVANATLLANCAPIFVTLAAWLLFGRRPRMQFVGGLVTALVGMVMLLRRDFSHSGSALVGDALGLVTAMFYAAYQLAVTRARRSVSTARIMLVSGLVTSTVLLPLALISGERFIPADEIGWLPLIGLALISQVGGQSLIAYAMAHLPATFSSVGLMLQPVVAAVLAWVVLSEALTASAVAGGVLVLVGIRIAHGARSDEQTGGRLQ